MNLTPVEIDAIHVGQPLPFSLLSENGTLLAIKGYVIKQREELDTLTLQRSKLYIDITESESHRRAYMSVAGGFAGHHPKPLIASICWPPRHHSRASV